MSDAPVVETVPVVEQGVPPVAVVEPAETNKVFAGNLSYNTKEEELKAFFEPVASDIVNIQLIMRGSRPSGYGFVSMSSQAAAEKAVELLNKKELDGREVQVEIAKPIADKTGETREKKPKRKPGRRGEKAIPGEVTEAEANGEAKPETAEGGADEAAKPKKKKKKSAKKPKAKTEDGAAAPADGEAAPAADGAAAPAEAAKKAPKAKKPKKPTRPAGEDPVGEPSKTMLFVANLGFNTDDAALSAIFTEANIAVVSARVVRRRWGTPRKSKGYGFVDVGSPEEQQKAIVALEGKELDGRVIAVKVAVDTPKDDAAADEDAAEAAEPDAVIVAT